MRTVPSIGLPQPSWRRRPSVRRHHGGVRSLRGRRFASSYREYDRSNPLQACAPPSVPIPQHSPVCRGRRVFCFGTYSFHSPRLSRHLRRLCRRAQTRGQFQEIKRELGSDSRSVRRATQRAAPSKVRALCALYGVLTRARCAANRNRARSGSFAATECRRPALLSLGHNAVGCTALVARRSRPPPSDLFAQRMARPPFGPAEVPVIALHVPPVTNVVLIAATPFTIQQCATRRKRRPICSTTRSSRA